MLPMRLHHVGWLAMPGPKSRGEAARVGPFWDKASTSDLYRWRDSRSEDVVGSSSDALACGVRNYVELMSMAFCAVFVVGSSAIAGQSPQLGNGEGPSTYPCKFAALQTEYSLWSRDPERELLPVCQRLGITFMAYSPLGCGFLTGSIRSSADLETTDFRRTHPRFQEDNLRANLGFVDHLRSLAEASGHTAAQLALAWIIQQPWDIVPIVGTRSSKHLAENVRALDIEPTASELTAIAAAVPPELIQGERHPASHMKTIES